MKRRLSMLQMIIGLVLCGMLLTTFFLPRYSLDAEKMGKVYSKMFGDSMKGVLGDFYEAVGKNEIEKMVSEAVDGTIEELEKQGIPNHLSGFYIVTHFNLQGFMAIVRVYIVFSLLVVAVLLTGILLAGFGKMTKWISISMVWLLFLLESAYLVAVIFVVPTKAGSSMPNIMGMDLSNAGGKLVRQLIWSLHGLGFYIELASVVLLLAWSIWCCISFGRKEKVQPQPMPAMAYETSEPQDLSPVMPISAIPQEASEPQALPPVMPMPQIDETLFVTMPEQRITGRIVGVVGTIMGAEIILNPGENITVGRDPSSCQLILENAKISRKHFQIGYNQATEKYHIECYSKNGVHLSDNRTVMAFQGMDVEHGTKIVLADGKEILLLK